MTKQYRLNATCYDCGKENHVVVAEHEIEQYQTGELVQKVWPDTDTWFREVIIGWRTGLYQCQSCHEAFLEDMAEEA